jgi:hypothetical protein
LTASVLAVMPVAVAGPLLVIFMVAVSLSPTA